jgi:hypothetical protein
LRTWMDGALAKTPGFSSLLPAKRDIFGEKIQVQPGFPQSAFNPFPVTKSNNDPVTRELARLAQSDAQSNFSTPSEHVGNADLTQFKNAKSQSATTDGLNSQGMDSGRHSISVFNRQRTRMPAMETVSTQPAHEPTCCGKFSTAFKTRR